MWNVFGNFRLLRSILQNLKVLWTPIKISLITLPFDFIGKPELFKIHFRGRNLVNNWSTKSSNICWLQSFWSSEMGRIGQTLLGHIIKIAFIWLLAISSVNCTRQHLQFPLLDCHSQFSHSRKKVQKIGPFSLLIFAEFLNLFEWI